MEKGKSASQALARSFSCGVSGASPAAGESARSGVPDELSAISAGRASGEWRMENGEWKMEKVPRSPSLDRSLNVKGFRRPAGGGRG